MSLLNQKPNLTYDLLLLFLLGDSDSRSSSSCLQPYHVVPSQFAMLLHDLAATVRREALERMRAMYGFPWKDSKWTDSLGQRAFDSLKEAVRFLLRFCDDPELVMVFKSCWSFALHALMRTTAETWTTWGMDRSPGPVRGRWSWRVDLHSSHETLSECLHHPVCSCFQGTQVEVVFCFCEL